MGIYVQNKRVQLDESDEPQNGMMIQNILSHYFCVLDLPYKQENHMPVLVH